MDDLDDLLDCEQDLIEETQGKLRSHSLESLICLTNVTADVGLIRSCIM